MSGYPENSIGTDGVLDEAWDLIAKPFTPAELLARIEASVQGHQMQAPKPVMASVGG